MPKLRILSGKEVVGIVSLFGFKLYSQTGSHIKMRRIVGQIIQVLVIPNHAELKKGMTKAMFNQASEYISEEKLRPYFYTK